MTREADCLETQWVSNKKIQSITLQICFKVQTIIFIFIYLFSTIENVLLRIQYQRIGSVRCVKHQEKVKETHDDDVILLNLESA